LPTGLKQCEKLPEFIFTPATKAERGQHDENISFERCVGVIGEKAANYVRDKSIEIFKKAGEYAKSKGIILADTKFEWGVVDGRIILIDEVLTPDSSRFWPADKYEAGRDQESFDKQFVRNYLESINFDKFYCVFAALLRKLPAGYALNYKGQGEDNSKFFLNLTPVEEIKKRMGLRHAPGVTTTPQVKKTNK